MAICACVMLPDTYNCIFQQRKMWPVGPKAPIGMYQVARLSVHAPSTSHHHQSQPLCQLHKRLEMPSGPADDSLSLPFCPRLLRVLAQTTGRTRTRLSGQEQAGARYPGFEPAPAARPYFALLLPALSAYTGGGGGGGGGQRTQPGPSI